MDGGTVAQCQPAYEVEDGEMRHKRGSTGLGLRYPGPRGRARERPSHSNVATGVIAVAWLLAPAMAHAWGSVELGPGWVPGARLPATHQYIDAQVLERLRGNPAFREDQFPGADEIRRFGTISLSQIGDGPDAIDASLYSSHYYNPALAAGTSAGGGPQASGEFLGRLIGQLQVDPADAARDAAWSSHFLADMFVPYHVVGCSAADLAVLRARCGEPCERIELPGVITGPLYLCSPLQGNEFHTEIGRFPATGTGTQDWFDPWYWNATTSLSPNSSSHLGWEVGVAFRSTGTLEVDPLWREGVRGAAPVDDWWFDGYRAGQVELATRFAAACAGRTRASIGYYFRNGEVALTAAAGAVYTLWRASFSALRPSARLTSVAGEDGSSGLYDITCTVRNTDGEDAAEGVRVRLTPLDSATLLSGERIQSLGTGSLAPGAEGTGGSWRVRSADGGTCRVKVEAIATYRNTPDLQYAFSDEEPDGVGAMVIATGIEWMMMGGGMATSLPGAGDLTGGMASLSHMFQVVYPGVPATRTGNTEETCCPPRGVGVGGASGDTGTYPDGETGYGDGGSGYPDGGSTYSGSGAPAPGLKARRPPRGTGRGGAKSSYGDGEAAYDDGGTTYDDGETAYDDGESTYDDGETLYDDGESLYDDGETLYDDGETMYDDGESGESGGGGATEEACPKIPIQDEGTVEYTENKVDWTYKCQIGGGGLDCPNLEAEGSLLYSSSVKLRAGQTAVLRAEFTAESEVPARSTCGFGAFEFMMAAADPAEGKKEFEGPADGTSRTFEIRITYAELRDFLYRKIVDAFSEADRSSLEGQGELARCVGENFPEIVDMNLKEVTAVFMVTSKYKVETAGNGGSCTVSATIEVEGEPTVDEAAGGARRSPCADAVMAEIAPHLSQISGLSGMTGLPGAGGMSGPDGPMGLENLPALSAMPGAPGLPGGVVPGPAGLHGLLKSFGIGAGLPSLVRPAAGRIETPRARAGRAEQPRSREPGPRPARPGAKASPESPPPEESSPYESGRGDPYK